MIKAKAVTKIELMIKIRFKEQKTQGKSQKKTFKETLFLRVATRNFGNKFIICKICKTILLKTETKIIAQKYSNY